MQMRVADQVRRGVAHREGRGYLSTAMLRDGKERDELLMSGAFTAQPDTVDWREPEARIWVATRLNCRQRQHLELPLLAFDGEVTQESPQRCILDHS